MKTENHVHLTPRIKEAIDELKGLITARFPQAAFVVEEGFDPEGTYLVTTVDIADTDDVIAVVGDRLVELQVDEGLPVYVTPLRPLTASSLNFGIGRQPRRRHRCCSPKEMPGRDYDSYQCAADPDTSHRCKSSPSVARFWSPAPFPLSTYSKSSSSTAVILLKSEFTHI